MPLIILIFFSLSGHALELKASDGKSFSFIAYEGTRVSKSCKKPCKALTDYTKKAAHFKHLGGNPASELCHHLGGKDRIVSHPNLDQDSVCIFEDGSYILSWDLFRKNRKTTP